MKNNFINKSTLLKHAPIPWLKLIPGILAVVSLQFSGCLNAGQKSGGAPAASNSSSSSGASTSTGTTLSAGLAFNIVALNLTDAPGSPVASIQFNSAGTSASLTQVCTPAPSLGVRVAAPGPCVCRFEWNESNRVTGQSFTRSALSAVTAVDPYRITCSTPSIYMTEIPDATAINVTVYPDAAQNNVSVFRTNTWRLVKSSSFSSADFRDADGRALRNISHYVCHDKPQRAQNIARLTEDRVVNVPVAPGGMPRSTSVRVSLVNKFQTSNLGPSAESYYYDFYVRSDGIGSINTSNASFDCPLVRRTRSGADVTDPYPLDSQFALALQSGGNYTVPVQANITLDISTPQGGVAADRMLGYAAKANADGSCPAVLGDNNQPRQTYRLRRYTVAYPVRFSSDGNPQARTEQPSNSFYVLDRPVKNNGTLRNANGTLAVLSRLGPKPCPFSQNIMVDNRRQYKCTSNFPTGLNSINLDGIAIQGQAACPIFPPPATDQIKRGTLQIRPIEAWTPEYLEDATFKACAYPSNQPIDPDLVLISDPDTDAKHFYCAKSYPSHTWVSPSPYSPVFATIPSDCEDTHPRWSDTQAVPTITAQSIRGKNSFSCAITASPSLTTKFDAMNLGAAFRAPAQGCCAPCQGSSCVRPQRTAELISNHPSLTTPNPAVSISAQNGCVDPY